ncbi:helix-turn-helix transcriptional regulator [Chitinophaga sp. Cy-1792]|uniref:helix-turn-helix domain-containing protein n=1 Tax=Chitinophaga sp. Cy-1792 TaxID=2608339 RepID=UPI00142231DC|nr:helix-turn-helix transcriptional regulator [Chitinophaga sp. Cy-1792]NIG57391.1 helix-turn-helix transcriptional regulator [Chitinophaga sp. Cy-1792]
MKSIVFVVEKTTTGYSAYANDFDKYPVGTTAENIEQLRKNVLDATNLYLSEIGKKVVKENDISLVLDVRQFFEFYKIINAKALAERIGMSQSLLSQYANGIKKPSEKQTDKILEGVRQLGRELAKIEFI